MIEIVGREMVIPKNEESVGFVGDDNMETREFTITNTNLFDLNFKLDLIVKGHTDIADLEKQMDGDKLKLKWYITKNTLQKSGMLFAQIRGFKETGESWHSEKGKFWIGEGMDAAYAENPIPSEFEQMEQQITAARNETVSAKDVVLKNANDVAANTKIVVADTETVVLKASEIQYNSETVIQSTEVAMNSANIAAQSLADLLAMLGTDIATLTGGKLTPSQIPAISINDVFSVKNETAMLTLIAERGDVAIIIPEDTVIDSYILSSDDPTQMSNWKRLGVSYVANAGHSITAGEATNAVMINGHRQIRMTQAQYDIAYASGTLDDNTDYWVAG